MPLVVGLNHQTAPIDVREKLAIPVPRLSEILHQLKSAAPVSELVLLSTCNRTEVYACSSQRREALDALKRELERHGHLQPSSNHLYVHEGEQAVQHLFRVASGLDSMVKGENEILGQVKQAYLHAQESGFTGKLLNVLFQRSLFVGKRVRTETGLSSGSSSVGSVAVAMAERIFDNLRDRVVMIMGAGKMAELTTKYLLSQKVRSILVSNRSFERAQTLAAQFGGRALTFEQGMTAMEEADIVICSTAAPHPIIHRDQVSEVMRRRNGRLLFFIDIAVPRDVDPAVHDIDNVYLYDIDDLQKIVNENLSKRSSEVMLAERIVGDETHEFTHWLRAHHAGITRGLRHTAAPSRTPVEPDRPS